jgi:hypothetical protein
MTPVYVMAAVVVTEGAVNVDPVSTRPALDVRAPAPSLNWTEPVEPDAPELAAATSDVILN